MHESRAILAGEVGEVRVWHGLLVRLGVVGLGGRSDESTKSVLAGESLASEESEKRSARKVRGVKGETTHLILH